MPFEVSPHTTNTHFPLRIGTQALKRFLNYKEEDPKKGLCRPSSAAKAAT